MDELIIRKTVTLNADTSRVWEALVNPQMTKQYMFGCEVVSDWKPGSKIQWVGISKGKEKVYIEGVIVRIDRGKTLKYAIINSHIRYVDTPSNYIQVTYVLSTKFGKTELSVEQGDFSKVEDGRRRYYEADEGLDYTLEGLKLVVEGTLASKKKPPTVADEIEEDGEKNNPEGPDWMPDQNY